MTDPLALELARKIGDNCLKLNIPMGSNGPHSFTSFNEDKAAAIVEAALAERDAEIERMVSNIKEAMCFSMAEEARVCLENALSTNGKDNNNGMA